MRGGRSGGKRGGVVGREEGEKREEQGRGGLEEREWVCTSVPVHRSRYKRPNNTRQLTNDS